ncbi:FecR family protein, partial [Burkholderia sola]|uniref:FecR family protein n=1 Tax=Burkholderia sola TaxID=2843302 RepID=UPI0033900016
MAWHLRSRRAKLAQGRVLLEVAHSELRPFTVQADRAQVRVTGTRFEVERRKDEVAVYLDQGAVQLHLDQRLPGEEEHYALRPGMSATLGAHRATLLAQG